jgi:hypothetical protein
MVDTIMTFEDEVELQFGIQDIEYFDIKEFTLFCGRFREIAPETYVR